MVHRLPKMEPEVAAELFGKGEVLLLSAADVGRLLFGHPQGLLPYLRSGELAAQGIPDGKGGYTQITLRSDDVLAFMVRHNLTMHKG